MSEKISPKNKMAQVLYRAAGNPANTLPNSAISNCFPGLDYDFKAFWRRAFVGIVLMEWDNLVADVEDSAYDHLKHHRLLKIENLEVVVPVTGPQLPDRPPGDLMSSLQPGNVPGVVAMEWSNCLAFVLDRQGKKVKCYFTKDESLVAAPIPKEADQLQEVELVVRHIFDGDSAAPAPDLIKPGELTQGLCSPWQHDYRECSCYYWPASRPDYVNVEQSADGVTRGDNWISHARTGEYILDDRKDTRLVTYVQLFREWEAMLRFQIEGRDAQQS